MKTILFMHIALISLFIFGCTSDEIIVVVLSAKAIFVTLIHLGVCHDEHTEEKKRASDSNFINY